MNIGCDERETQVAFHRHADVARFTNRLENPFIRAKEIALARRIAQHVPGDARVLEVGCGEGSNLWFLARERRRSRLSGVDFSVAKLEFLRVSQPNVSAIAADALHLPFVDGSFETVLCRDLLHHVNWDRDRLVGECLRVLRPGGILIVLEGNGRTFLNWLFRTWYPAERGMRDSTPATVSALLGRYGRPALEFVEPSSLLRAAGFVLGWPQGPGRLASTAVYAAATCWERVMAVVLPRGRWVYMLGTVRRELHADSPVCASSPSWPAARPSDPEVRGRTGGPARFAQTVLDKRAFPRL